MEGEEKKDKVSEPLVMKSAAGYYVGLQYFDEDAQCWLPYDRLGTYYAEESSAIEELKTYGQ
tara:strand:- start:230 stop:415 length:186 start_codon:yes stop_codon:yes gene_type:complete